MDDKPLVQITFGKEGTDRYHLGAGWAGDEPGYRWTVGPQSEVWLDNPNQAMDCVLEIEVLPFVAPPSLSAQRAAVFVRGALVGRVELQERRRLGFRVPAGLLAGQGPIRVVFQHPDAAAPTAHGYDRDVRELALCFQHLALRSLEEGSEGSRIERGQVVIASDIAQMTGEPAAQFMRRFESLGDNCEFGLVQRRCGSEPLGLLRFSNIDLSNLTNGIDAGFKNLGDPSNMEFWLHRGGRREYVLRDKSYHLVFHTFRYEGEVNENELIEQQSARLKFLRRKILEDLANGEKIFVVKRNEELQLDEVLPLLTALRRHAPTARLLYVVPATSEHPSGTAELAAPGLVRGFIDRFAPTEAAQDLSLEPWLAVCVNAYRLLAHAP
jgi:hypothetical protein